MSGTSRTEGGRHVVDVATLTLRDLLLRVVHYLPLAAERPDEDIEHVHQLRVSSRRAAAAVRLYRPLLPPASARWMTVQLKRIRRAADAARDFDVMGEGLPTAGLCRRRKLARQRAQQPIIAVHKRLRRGQIFASRCARLVGSVRLPDGLTSPSFRSFGALRLLPVLDDLFTAGEADLHSPGALHRLRIRAKKLRYTMELLADAFPPVLGEELQPLVKSLQSMLGEINDHHTGRKRLMSWLRRARDEDLRAIVEMIHQLNVAFEHSRQQFFDWWTPQRQAELRARFDVLLADAAGGEQPSAGQRAAI